MKYVKIKKNLLTEGADPTLGGISYTVQGTPGYVYRILPLSHDLEQKPNQAKEEYYIYPGCTVRGVGINNPGKYFTGQVQRIVKDSNGEIKYLYIKTIKTNRFVTILADEHLRLILHNHQPIIQHPAPVQFTVSRNMKL